MSVRIKAEPTVEITLSTWEEIQELEKAIRNDLNYPHLRQLSNSLLDLMNKFDISMIPYSK